MKQDYPATRRWMAPTTLVACLVGVFFGMGILHVSTNGLPRSDDSGGFPSLNLGVGDIAGVLPLGLLARAKAELGTGEYEFFPNRRSMWVVNRVNGRMATYHFRDDEVGSVDRSRVHRINLETFPRKDTSIALSDRNLNNVLWVCNTRTGDVQMWYPARDGTLRSEMPVATSADLMERTP